MKYIKQFEDNKKYLRIILTNDYDFGSDSSDNFKLYLIDKMPDKYQEQYKNMKFHVGDIVRWVYYRNEKTKYIIDAVDVINSNCYHLETFPPPHIGHNNFRWVGNEEIEKVPQYEIDAEKYNL